jgi:hypothetical protein
MGNSHEWEIKVPEGGGRGLYQCTVPVFSSRNWGKSRECLSVTACNPADIRIGFLPNISQQCYRYTNLVGNRKKTTKKPSQWHQSITEPETSHCWDSLPAWTKNIPPEPQVFHPWWSVVCFQPCTEILFVSITPNQVLVSGLVMICKQVFGVSLNRQWGVLDIPKTPPCLYDHCVCYYLTLETMEVVWKSISLFKNKEN